MSTRFAGGKERTYVSQAVSISLEVSYWECRSIKHLTVRIGFFGNLHMVDRQQFLTKSACLAPARKQQCLVETEIEVRLGDTTRGVEGTRCFTVRVVK
jgi:hypothetical protein